QAAHAPAQDIARPLAFPLIFLVRQGFAPAAKGDPQDLASLALEGQDLTPDEAVADLRVLIDEVGELQHATCIRSARNVRRDTSADNISAGRAARRNIRAPALRHATSSR